MRLSSAGILFLGTAANVNMTLGLTIGQGSADDEILTLQSSDVAHGITDDTDTDTFGLFRKVDGSAGGLKVAGYRDADGGGNFGLMLEGNLGEAAAVDDTSTSSGVVVFNSQIKSGTGTAAVADVGNAFTFENATTTRLLIKGDGALHATNVTAGSGDLDGTALDGEDDIGLIRVFERTVHEGMGIAMTKWDEQIKSNEDDLKTYRRFIFHRRLLQYTANE